MYIGAISFDFRRHCLPCHLHLVIAFRKFMEPLERKVEIQPINRNIL
jgi:hypothetical protein